MQKNQQCQYDKANILQVCFFFFGEEGARSWQKGNQHKKSLAKFRCCQAPWQTVKLHTNVHNTWQLTAEHESPSLDSHNREDLVVTCLSWFRRYASVLFIHTNHRKQVRMYLQESHANERTIPEEMSCKSATINFRILPT